MIVTRVISIGLGGFLLIKGASEQTLPAPESHAPAKCDDQVRSTYLLGPDDSLDISGPELTEVANKAVRINSDGDIQVPPAGRVHVGGLTVQRTEQELNKVLSTYIRHPQVIVTITELRTQPRPILAPLNTPPPHPLPRP